jgi:hypothetical protein
MTSYAAAQHAILRRAMILLLDYKLTLKRKLNYLHYDTGQMQGHR